MLRTVLRALRAALVVGVSVGALWMVGTLFWWCVDSAYDELQHENSTWGYAAFLLGLGLAPVVAGLFVWWGARRVGTWSRGTAWTVAAAVAGGLSVPLLIVRAWLPPPG